MKCFNFSQWLMSVRFVWDSWIETNNSFSCSLLWIFDLRFSMFWLAESNFCAICFEDRKALDLRKLALRLIGRFFHLDFISQELGHVFVPCVLNRSVNEIVFWPKWVHALEYGTNCLDQLLLVEIWYQVNLQSWYWWCNSSSLCLQRP